MSDNNKIILAIESSCDETACAVVKNGRQVLSNVVYSQANTHALYGGVVPEVASRMHIEVISDVVNSAIEQAHICADDLDAIAVTYAPGLIGALLVGVNFAKSMAYGLDKPLVPVHHIRSHIAANYLAFEKLAPPFMCLVVSGGHSNIVLVHDYTKFEIIGATRDDAAGEAFDKIARILSLPYPGGVHIDELAKKGDKSAIKFPKVNFDDAPYDFSFSGVKTNVINYVHKLEQKKEEINKEDIAACFSHAVCSVLVEKAIAACKKYNINSLCLAGGVAANSMLREYITKEAKKENISLYIPPVSLCGDNAAMVGAQGYYEYLSGKRADISLNAYATKSIEQG